jgi:hypothetical protein
MTRMSRAWVLAFLIPAFALQARAAQLPQQHEYQKQLRAFMATLTEKDFEHGVTTALTAQGPGGDQEAQYRNFLLTLMQQPLVGTKRGTPSVNAPAKLFLLTSIEGPEAVMVPPVWAEALISFVQWNYPGNPYYDNRALKLRAFVTAAVNMMMLDDHLDKNPEAGRSDWHSYQLVYFACPYAGFKDLLPPDVQKAYQVGVRRMGERIIAWGPKGEEPNLDMIAPVGLWYASRVVDDPEFTKAVEAHARMFFTDPRLFHPAGYSVERGGIDVGFQGMTNFFACWVALASDWPFAKEAVERMYRLRTHLMLPEPDGKFVGPCHFNCRTSSDASDDQWHWDGARDYAASLITDEAACLVKTPTAEELANAAPARAAAFNHHIAENPRVHEEAGLRHISNDEIRSQPWQWRMWNTWNFPASVNPGYEFYRKGAYAHRLELEKANSPFLKFPFQREGTFIRDFEKAFYAAKMPTYGVILHTGPVGSQHPEERLFQFAGPLGFGGGQLSAFWTPSTGSVILGRRGGMHWDKTFDTVEGWRSWPIHAVSGCKPDGKVFTTARILRPDVSADVKDDRATVHVSGVIPSDELGQGKVLDGTIEYARVFHLEPAKVSIETRVKADGKDDVSELYETLPVFLRDAQKQAQAAPTDIQFQVGGTWAPATAEYHDRVTAVRLTRFDGAVQITFDSPRRVKLSAADWQDSYLSRATCRNIMVDMLAGKAAPVRPAGETTIRYEISPAAK